MEIFFLFSSEEFLFLYEIAVSIQHLCQNSFLTMLVNIHCAKCIGIDAIPVTVEVDVTKGIGIHLVGLADAAVKESLLRTITAMQTLGYHVPGKKIVINLSVYLLCRSIGKQLNTNIL